MTDHSLPDVPFAGHDRFIAAIDGAVAAGDEHAVTAALRGALCGLIRDPDVQLPGCVYEPIADHYARREIYRSPEHGYSVVAMTWAPGQGTPVHDHCGLWCVEGVWDGELEITPVTDKVTVTVVEKSDNVTYDAAEHSITGYETMTADNALYDIANVAETPTAPSKPKSSRSGVALTYLIAPPIELPP